jgi:YD repeat-containing protein
MKGDHIMQIQMKLVAGALAMLLGGTAFAQHITSHEELQAIARASGLSVPEVRMVLSESHTAYTTWNLSYDASARRLRQAVQDGRVNLMPTENGVHPDFATWQRLPTRGLSLAPSNQADIAEAGARGGN